MNLLGGGGGRRGWLGTGSRVEGSEVEMLIAVLGVKGVS